jgi:predicted XRE-type DNA-binding protein
VQLQVSQGLPAARLQLLLLLLQVQRVVQQQQLQQLQVGLVLGVQLQSRVLHLRRKQPS